LYLPFRTLLAITEAEMAEDLDEINEDDDFETIRRKLTPTKPPEGLEPAGYLPTGSTLLNLAISGKIDGGYPLGRYTYMVGDSGSGKTWFSLTCMAEAARIARFKKHRFIFDNPERGALMDFERYFGSEMARRLEPPKREKDGTPIYSVTTEDFYYNLDDALKEGPCIYVLDSMDALDTKQDAAKFDSDKKAKKKGEESTGSYGMSKAKENSTKMRKVCSMLEQTESILIVIGQTRTDIKSQFGGKTRAGGHALTFYAHLEFWTEVAFPVKRSVNARDRNIGAWISIYMEKNRVSGWIRNSVSVPFFHQHGLDDIGSCVRYLVLEKHWPKNKDGVVTTSGLGLKPNTEEKIIQEIQRLNKEDIVRMQVQKIWDKVQEACRVKRKANYL
jgi:RecA/RadA recombinase